MSEKVTFQELIESIAEETDNTEQFTHDFLKDFVDIINGGLQQNDTVNIAGFGKFELRQMDERVGYNPQTEEKITIPEHNKVVFKPYKNIRELVNAPYAHLEPELIEEEPATEQEDAASETSETEQKQTELTGADQEEITAEDEQGVASASQPSAEDSESKASSPDDDTKSGSTQGEEDESDRDPFGFDEDDTADSAPNELLQEIANDRTEEQEDNDADENIDESTADEDKDIVEFQGSPTPQYQQGVGKDDEPSAPEPPDSEGNEIETSATEKSKETGDPEGGSTDDEPGEAPNWLNAIVGPEASEKVQPDDQESTSKNQEEPQEAESKETAKSDSAYMPGNESSGDQKEVEQPKKESETAAPQMDRNMPDRNSGNSLGIWVAAAVILLMLGGGALYFSLFQNAGQTDTDTQKIASTATVQSRDTDQQQEESAGQQKAEESKDKTASQTKDGKQKATTQQSQQPAQQSTTAKSAKAKTSANTTAENSSQESHSIKKGQTLWSIAEDKYGNPRLWPWIYGKNSVLTNPNTIETGRSLTVPLPSGAQNTLTQSDSVGVAKGFLSTYQWYKNNKPSKAKNHLWAAVLYHQDIRDIATIQIDQADLSYANSVR